MTTIYMKSPDERTVVSIHGRYPEPNENDLARGYVQIGQKEFIKLKRRIFGSLGVRKIRLEQDQEHNVEICPFCDAEWDPNNKPKSVYD